MVDDESGEEKDGGGGGCGERADGGSNSEPFEVGERRARLVTSTGAVRAHAELRDVRCERSSAVQCALHACRTLPEKNTASVAALSLSNWSANARVHDATVSSTAQRARGYWR